MEKEEEEEGEGEERKDTFKGYLERLCKFNIEAEPGSHKGLSSIGKTVRDSTASLMCMDALLALFNKFTEKDHGNAGIPQKIMYLIMYAVCNTSVTVVDSDEVSKTDADDFFLAVLMNYRKNSTMDPRSLIEGGFGCVPEYLYEAAKNIFFPEHITYVRFCPEKAATEADVAKFIGAIEDTTELDELFRSGPHRDNATATPTTTTPARILCKTECIENIEADLDRVLALKDLREPQLISEVIVLMDKVLSFMEAVKAPNETLNSALPKLLEVVGMYFEAMCGYIREKGFITFFEIPGANDIIQSVSNILCHNDAKSPLATIASNIRNTYGVAVLLLSSIIQQTYSGQKAEDFAEVAPVLATAIGMLADTTEAPQEAQTDSFLVTVFPGVSVNVLAPVPWRELLDTKVKEAAPGSDLAEFVLRVMTTCGLGLAKSGLVALPIKPCAKLLKAMVEENTHITERHLSAFVHFLEVISGKEANSSLTDVTVNSVDKLKVALLEKEGCVSLQALGAVLKEINSSYKLAIPKEVLYFVYSMALRKKWEEPTAAGFVRGFMDELMRVTLETEYANGGNEMVDYSVFCLITYIFHHALTPESKMALITTVDDFIINNHTKKLNQLGLIRVLVFAKGTTTTTTTTTPYTFHTHF